MDAEGLLATACGWSPDAIDQMTLPRFERLCRYWSAHPPLHLLVAAYLGVPAGERRKNDLGELLAMAKSNGGAIR